jgi:hypothetical protein
MVEMVLTVFKVAMMLMLVVIVMVVVASDSKGLRAFLVGS